MDMLFGVELPTYVKKSLESVSEEYLEDLRLWNKTPTEIVNHLEQACIDHLVFIMHQDNISLVFMDKTPYTFVMHVLPGKDFKPNKLIRIIQEALTFYKEKADTHKLEAVTTCPDMWKTLTKCGFSQEGCLIESRKVPSGEFVDEYVLGYLLDVGVIYNDK